MRPVVVPAAVPVEVPPRAFLAETDARARHVPGVEQRLVVAEEQVGDGRYTAYAVVSVDKNAG